MGERREWKQDDISHQAWLRVLMGRRPPSVRWPAVHGRNASAARAPVLGRSWDQRPSGVQSAKPHPPQRSSTEVMAEAAKSRHNRSSHRRIGGEGTEKQVLQEALKGVRKAAHDDPVGASS